MSSQSENVYSLIFEKLFLHLNMKKEHICFLLYFKIFQFKVTIVFDRFDNTTGTFTVPPGGDGYYYFSVYLSISGELYIVFDVKINGQVLCSANSFLSETNSNIREPASCSAVTYAMEGWAFTMFLSSAMDLQLTSPNCPFH